MFFFACIWRSLKPSLKLCILISLYKSAKIIYTQKSTTGLDAGTGNGMAKSVLDHAGEPFDAATATFLVIRGFLSCLS